MKHREIIKSYRDNLRNRLSQMEKNGNTEREMIKNTGLLATQIQELLSEARLRQTIEGPFTLRSLNELKMQGLTCLEINDNIGTFAKESA